MPEYLAPGVYVEEIERGPKPIEGVATSTVAFLGKTERGPLTPRFVTSYSAYLRLYGDIFSDTDYLPYAVRTYFDNGGRRCYIARVIGQDAAQAEFEGDFTLQAIGEGEWGNRIRACISPGTTKAPPEGGGDPVSVGFRLTVFYWSDSAPEDLDLSSAEGLANALGNGADLVEDFDDLSLSAINPNFWEKRVSKNASALVEMTGVAASEIPSDFIAVTLAGGSDGEDLIKSSFEGSDDANNPFGLKALDLDEYRNVSIVHAPATTDAALNLNVAQAVISHCESNRFRFAVVDCDLGLSVPSQIDPRTTIQDSKYAAFYYPWVEISDPRSGVKRKIPPGGFACGIYARTDNTRGVWKAPANEALRGALGLEFDINQATQELLNPRGVNCIRRFPGRGIRIWGARTLSSDSMWKYINVRRLFIFIEHSIYENTQWVVFEPNNQQLWARVKQSLTLFLRTQWQAGALLGSTEEEAFSVNIGYDTMTEDDLLNGRLIVEVGIAPVRPAEFVIFRVFQKTQEARS